MGLWVYLQEPYSATPMASAQGSRPKFSSTAFVGYLLPRPGKLTEFGCKIGKIGATRSPSPTDVAVVVIRSCLHHKVVDHHRVLLFNQLTGC